MAKKVQVPDSLSAKVAEFAEQETLQWDIVGDGDCDIAIMPCSERRQSNLGVIYAGGWITCEAARAIAPGMDMTLAQMGRLLDALSVKIRHCSLGCFK